jgi:hypothetical protein
MHVDGDEIHETAEEARAGATPNVTRWVLIFGLIGAIALLTIIWVTGALSSDQNNQTVNAQVRAAQNEARGSNTDSIVGDSGQTDAATPGGTSEPQDTPNTNTGQ